MSMDKDNLLLIIIFTSKMNKQQILVLNDRRGDGPNFDIVKKYICQEYYIRSTIKNIAVIVKV